MLEGVMLLWFVLAALSLAFVAFDIRSTPESTVMKWGLVLLAAYTGPIGAFLYVLGCREPLPGLHERYVAVRWRQVLGSTMHCVAGDRVGILVGAVLARRVRAWLHVRLDRLSSPVHARHGGLVRTIAQDDVRPGIPLDEHSDGGHGPGGGLVCALLRRRSRSSASRDPHDHGHAQEYRL